MNEQNKHTSKMPADRVATTQLGFELADAAFLHDAGQPGITHEELKQRWADASLLGRNAVEEALGLEKPYGAGHWAEEAATRNRNLPGQQH